MKGNEASAMVTMVTKSWSRTRNPLVIIVNNLIVAFSTSTMAIVCPVEIVEISSLSEILPFHLLCFNVEQHNTECSNLLSYGLGRGVDWTNSMKRTGSDGMELKHWIMYSLYYLHRFCCWLFSPSTLNLRNSWFQSCERSWALSGWSVLNAKNWKKLLNWNANNRILSFVLLWTVITL